MIGKDVICCINITISHMKLIVLLGLFLHYCNAIAMIMSDAIMNMKPILFVLNSQV